MSLWCFLNNSTVKKKYISHLNIKQSIASIIYVYRRKIKKNSKIKFKNF